MLFTTLANQQETVCFTFVAPVSRNFITHMHISSFTHAGSSETLRETTNNSFDFSSFNKVLPQHKSHIDTLFLEWFLGFAEGDGSWICTTNARNLFYINQKEIQILHRIRTTLGFGRVSHHGTYSRYTVADKPSVDRLIALFNGNLLLNKTHNRFSRWCDWANQSRKVPIVVRRKLEPSQPILSRTGWLAGFTDAEGCFNAQRIRDPRYTQGYRVRLRWTLDQHDEHSLLLHVRDLLGGGFVAVNTQRKKKKAAFDPNNIVLSSNPSVPGAEISVKPSKGENDQGDDPLLWRLSTWSLVTHERLLRYLQSHPLRSKKKVDSTRFFSLYNYIIMRKTMPWQGKVLMRVTALLDRLEVTNDDDDAKHC